jgi:hypothetical protein
MGELNFFGVFVAPLLIWVVVALALSWVLRRTLAWIDFYRLVWHRPLFDFAMLVILTGVVAVSTMNWLTQ